MYICIYIQVNAYLYHKNIHLIHTYTMYTSVEDLIFPVDVQPVSLYTYINLHIYIYTHIHINIYIYSQSDDMMNSYS